MILFGLFLINICFALTPTNADLRIINGTRANIADYPYAALLKIQDQPSCGATFISASILLTAAHCVLAIDTKDLSFQVGSAEADTGGEVIKAKLKIVHEKYCQDQKCLDYDLAIVKLAAEASAVTVIPAVLPEQNTILEDGMIATVLGWGYDGNDAFKTLQKLDVPMITQTSCAKLYEFADFNDRMICAGYIEGGKDYCWGDSGGPLIINDTLVGVASWSSACGQANLPGVYVNVVSFRSWIKEHSGI